MIWKVPRIDEEKAVLLAEDLSLSLPLARLLLLRGFKEAACARRFLEPRPEDTHDPYLMADMEKAVERTLRAIREKEKILIFGDYDVDGVTSITVVASLLRAAGVDFITHQPNRLEEGYGFQAAGAELARREGCGLILTVDCGTGAHAAIRQAREFGIDVIVIDHHQPRGGLPPATAILNPTRPDCSYPFKGLAAVGVAFKFLQAGKKRWGVELPRSRIWQLAALGTVADMVPLLDENRIIVRMGLELLRKRSDPSLRALAAVAGLEPQDLNTHHLSFQFAPRLNAAGRLGSPEVGLDLLGGSDPEVIRELAIELNRLNQVRRNVQAGIYEEAELKLCRRSGKYPDRVIVVEGEGWSKGVVGIVASKLQEKYYRPIFVIGLEGEDGVGSGRSIPGFDLFGALSRCGDLLERFGGHRQAAGLSIKKGMIDRFRERINAVAAETLGEEGLTPKLRLDGELRLEEIDLKLLGELDRLEPFGLGNPRPVFFSSALNLKGFPRIMGREQSHLKIRVEDGREGRECVGWGMAYRAGELSRGRIDIAYQLKVNEWRGRRTVQLVLKDFRPAS